MRKGKTGMAIAGVLIFQKPCDICRLFYLLRRMNSPGIDVSFEKGVGY